MRPVENDAFGSSVSYIVTECAGVAFYQNHVENAGEPHSPSRSFLVRDTRQSGTLVGAPQKCPLGHILNYYDGSQPQPQYTHLRAPRAKDPPSEGPQKANPPAA